MNEKALHTLEFDKIVGFLTEYAATPLGKDYCRQLVPLTDIDEIRTRQRQTSDAVSRLFAKGDRADRNLAGDRRNAAAFCSGCMGAGKR